jgi:beta-lactamase regulating signal transducer with metallopeptidase domain
MNGTTTLADLFTPFLVDAAIKATILLLLANFVVRCSRRSSAAFRHRVWSLTLLGLVALPAVARALPGWNLPATPMTTTAPTPRQVAPSEPASDTTSTPRVALRPQEIESVDTRPWPASTPFPVPAERPAVALGSPASWFPTPGLLLTLWAVGAIASAIPTLLGLVANALRRRNSMIVRDEGWTSMLDDLRRESGIHRVVELRQSDASPIPLTWGVSRPVILIPDRADCWSDETRRLVLRHELAHVRRLDVAWQLIGRLATSLFWFHPLAWHALHRLRLECEHAADDCVIRAGERPTDYARQLLNLARPLRLAHTAALVAMARPNTLEQRMNVMFDDARDHAPMGRGPSSRLALASVLLVLGLATARPPGPASAADEPIATKAQPTVTTLLAQPPGAGRIYGRVVLDASGDAAPGAQVILTPEPAIDELLLPGGKDFSRRTSTDAGGNFAFEGLSPGRYHLGASRGRMISPFVVGRGVGIEPTEAGKPGEPVEIRILQGSALKIVVKDDATGKPIQGANASIHWAELPSPPATDHDGLLVLQPLAPGPRIVSVWAEGYAKEARQVTMFADVDANINFRLAPGGTLEGLVRDAKNRPVPGVAIAARKVDETYESYKGVSGEDGRYRLDNLPIGLDLVAHLSKRDYPSKDVTFALKSRQKTLDITLNPLPDGGSITGTVVNKAGMPIAGARLMNRGDGGERLAETGADGRFVMKNLYEERNFGKEIVVYAKDYAPRRLKVQPGPPDKPAEVPVVLDPGHRIRGRVVDDTGQPLSKVSVALEHDPYGTFKDEQVITDGSGRFSFDSLPANSFFSFHKLGYSQIDQRKLPLDTGEVITVPMASDGEVNGHVVDSKTGRPVRAFNVQLNISAIRPGDPEVRTLHTRLLVAGEPYRSDEGRFTISHLVLGMPLKVTVSADGYHRQIEPRVVATRSNADAPTTFRLDPIDPATLRTYGGRMLDAGGLPVAGVNVRLIVSSKKYSGSNRRFPIQWSFLEGGFFSNNPEVELFLRGVTDDSGRFRFDGVPEDSEVELAWWRSGQGRGRTTHLERIKDDRKQSIDITMPAPGRLVGKIDRGAFPEAVLVEILRKDLGGAIVDLQPGQTDFEIGDLAPGDYGVALVPRYERETDATVVADLKLLAWKQVTIKAGETGHLEFEIKDQFETEIKK